MPQQRSYLLLVRITVAWVVSTIVLMTSPLQAQTFSVLHSFTGGADGSLPEAGLTLAGDGRFYGTTAFGGNPGAGVVYRLASVGTGWILTPLFAFPGGYYGDSPRARAIIGPNGTLFGTTYEGGYYGYGTVYNLQPGVNVCTAVLCGWNNTIIYRFMGGDGSNPGSGDLVFDQAGNIYGTTEQTDGGIVYELTPANGEWTESILYRFQSPVGGENPNGGVIFDSAGNLYGTTQLGGIDGAGVVYELSKSGSEWVETVLYNFQGRSDGANPLGDLVFDRLGNLYGTTSAPTGSIFELSPSQNGWTFTLIHDFDDDGPGPQTGVAIDGNGNLFGTTLSGAYGYGEIFEVTPDQNGGWTYTDVYDFFGAQDGSQPYGAVLLDANGNLFGTAREGGSHGDGVVWEITSVSDNPK